MGWVLERWFWEIWCREVECLYSFALGCLSWCCIVVRLCILAGLVVCALEAKIVLMNFLVLLTFKGREGRAPFKCLEAPTFQGSTPSESTCCLHCLYDLLPTAFLEEDSWGPSDFLPSFIGGTLLHKVLTGSPLVGDPPSCLIILILRILVFGVMSLPLLNFLAILFLLDL